MNSERKIFNLSVHRSATQSFHQACLDSGISSRHWPGFDFDKNCAPALEKIDTEFVWDQYWEKFQNRQAFCDLPMPFVFREAMINIPNGIFVLLVRPPEAWVRSARRHTIKRPLDVMEKLMYWFICGERREHVRDYSDKELIEAYSNHISNVSEFARRKGVSIHILNIESDYLAQDLSSVIGGQVAQFPNADINRKHYQSRDLISET